MKLLQFPIIKITIWYILGIVVSYYFRFNFTLIVVLTCLSTTGMIASNLQSLKTLQNKKNFALFLYPTLFFLGILLSTFSRATFKENHFYNQNIFGKRAQIVATVLEKLKTSDKYNRFLIEIHQIDEKKSTGKLILNIKKDKNSSLQIGQKIAVDDEIYPNPSPNNPNQFDFGKYLETKNIYGQIYTEANTIKINKKRSFSLRFHITQFREKIITNLKKAGFPEKELAVIYALILGQQQDINPEIVRDYQFAGAVHILSVSGLHVGFILLFITFILKPIPSSKLGRTSKLVLTITALWSFALVAGLAPSVIRSAVMFSCIAYGDYLKRQSNTYNTTIVSVFIILIVEPYLLFDIGFQLSYLAVFSLLLIEPILSQLWLPKHKIVTFFWKIMTVSIAAQLGTLPLSLYYFHQFPGLFFITNLIVIPFLEFIIMPLGLLLTLLAYLNITPVFLVNIVSYSIKGMNSFISIIASFDSFVLKEIPFTRLMLILTYTLLAFLISWLYKPNFKKSALLLLLTIFLQSTIIYYKAKANKNESFIVFNSKNNTIIGEMKNQKMIVYSKNKIVNQSFEEKMLNSFSTANFYIIKKKKPLKNCYYFSNNKILVIDSTISIPKNKTSDILILTQSPKVNLDRILNSLRPKQVVADASNFKNYIQLWKLTCKKRKIPFHSTYEKGFYKID